MALGWSAPDPQDRRSVRALQAKGHQICNLTVGDFLPKEFPIPPLLRSAIARAYEARETNYPPSDGMLATRGGAGVLSSDAGAFVPA